MTTQTTKHKWTGEQEAIFGWFESGNGNGMGNALPGCTKTSTSVEGINRAPACKTLYTVFNKKNQLEAEEKITNRNVAVKTLHSLGFSFISQSWRGVRGDYSTEWNRVESLYPDAPKQIVLMVCQLVSKLKNHLIYPTLQDGINFAQKYGIDGGKEKVIYPEEKLAEMAIKVIDLSCEYPRDKRISFDDMVYLPSRLGLIKPSYDMIISDESQDVSAPQFDMLTKALNAGGRMFVVGDRNQQIYGWRGALQDSMEKFKQKLTPSQFKLTTNFRCAKNIIKFANTLMPELKAGPNAGDGVVETINWDKMLNQFKPNDAVLSRTNAPLMGACLAFLRKKTPAFIAGKDIGKNLINIVESLNAQNVNEFFDKLGVWRDNKVQRASGWFAATAIELANDQHETLRVLAENCQTVPEISSQITRLFQDENNVKIPSVILSTVHRAKGLEWDRVAILSDSFKGNRATTPEEQAEESNVYKVAITRPRNYLAFVSSK